MRITTTFLAVAFTLACAAASHAAMSGYLTLTGQKQGVIKGDSSNPGHRGAFDVIDIVNKADLLVNPETGFLAPDTTVHNPVVIIAAVDIASPPLFQALVSNQTFVNATLSFARPSSGGSGRLEIYYSIELTGGQIVSYKTYHSTSNVAPPKGKVFLEINLTYAEIACTFTKGGKSTSKRWPKSG